MYTQKPYEKEIKYCVNWLKRHKVIVNYDKANDNYYFSSTNKDYILGDYCNYTFKLFKREHWGSYDAFYLQIDYFSAVRVYAEQNPNMIER